MRDEVGHPVVGARVQAVDPKHPPYFDGGPKWMLGKSGVSHLIVPDVVVTDSGWLGGATKRHGRVTEEGSGLEGRFGASQPVLEGEASEHSRDPRDGPRYPVRVGMRAKAPNLVPFGCGR